MTSTGWRTWDCKWWPETYSEKARSSAMIRALPPKLPWSWLAEGAQSAERSESWDVNKLPSQGRSRMNAPINVVILAAGLGTRMKSKRAKVLHSAGGLTLVEHVVQTAIAITPPENVTVVVGTQAEQVEAVLAHSGVRFAEQKEQKGTG